MQSTPLDLSAVILDYGMVLCRKPSLEQIDRMAQIFGVDHATFWQLYEKNRGAYDKNEIDGKEYWSRFASNTNTHLSDSALEQLLHWDIEMWSNLEVPLLTWARSLRGAGFQTALLSNLHLRFSAYLRASSEWLQLFDHLIFSSEVRLIKPDPAIFLYCLKALGVKPQQALFIDDRDANIEAAHALGVRAIKYESVVQLEADLKAMQLPILPTRCSRITIPTRRCSADTHKVYIYRHSSSIYVDLSHANSPATLAANASSPGRLSPKPQGLEIWIRHQPKYGTEIGNFVSDPHALGGTQAARSILGNRRNRQTTSAYVSLYAKWSALCARATSVALQTPRTARGVREGEILVSVARRLAYRLLTCVLRHASPDSQEWASAMLRELDFVESDWGALLWALGSVTTLFRHSVPRRLRAGLEKRLGSAQPVSVSRSHRSRTVWSAAWKAHSYGQPTRCRRINSLLRPRTENSRAYARSERW